MHGLGVFSMNFWLGVVKNAQVYTHQLQTEAQGDTERVTQNNVK